MSEDMQHFDRDAYSLLQRAIDKLIELEQHADWKGQIIPRCPPVLWFGNTHDKDTSILTLGANPSSKEFLRRKISVQENPLEHLLQPGKQRFYLPEGEDWPAVRGSTTHLDRILMSYARYFGRWSSPSMGSRPYAKWFGRRSNIEAFLNGLGTTYYEGHPSAKLRAIHADLIPFATVSDFGKIPNKAVGTILTEGPGSWASGLLADILRYLSPKVIVIIHPKNLERFKRFIDPDMTDPSPVRYQGEGWSETYFFGHSERFGILVIGFSKLYLGNPYLRDQKVSLKGDELRAFGTHVRSHHQELLDLD
jgi:hypothetical protein